MDVDDDFNEWMISDNSLVIRSIIGGFPSAQASVLRQAFFSAFCAGGTAVIERHNGQLRERIELLRRQICRQKEELGIPKTVEEMREKLGGAA